MKVKKLSALTLGVSVLALTAGAFAVGSIAAPARAQFPAQLHFEQMDTDGDGKVTADEMAEFRANRFGQADTDGDGTLSLEEFQANAEARRAERMRLRRQSRFQQLDRDGDGRLSADEMPGAKFGGIMRFDLNDDGVVTEQELALAGPGRGGRGPGGPGGWGRGPGGPGGWGRGPGGPGGGCPMWGGGRW